MNYLSVLNILLALAYLTLAISYGSSHRYRHLATTIVWLGHGVVLVAQVASDLHFGFARALSMTSWLVIGIYFALKLWHSRFALPHLMLIIAGLSLGLATWIPGNRQLATSDPIEVLHWASGIAAYGLIAAALLHGALLWRVERDLHARHLTGETLNVPVLSLESLVFQLLLLGFVLLSTSLALAVFALPGASTVNHKLIFSGIAWTVFATLLLGRWRFGWRGKRALRWLFAGCTALALAYIGSRFVFEVVLQR